MDDKDEFFEFIEIEDEYGTLNKYYIIDEIEHYNKIYYITVPEEINELFFKTSIIILEKISDTYSIVNDPEILDELRNILDKIILEEEIEAITLLGNDGNTYEYNVLDKIEMDNNKYLLAIEIDDPEHNYIIFKVDNNQLTIISDKDEVLSLLKYFSNIKGDLYKEKNFYDSLSVSLEDKFGKVHNLSVHGKLEIKNNKYLIALSPDKDDDLIAISADKDDFSIKKSESSEDVTFYLKRIKSAIDHNPNLNPELN